MNKKQRKNLQKRQARQHVRRMRMWGRGVIACVVFGICFLGAMLLTSCSDHQDMYDAGIRVGNILLSDNTFVVPEQYDKGRMTAVGVVFYASGDTAIAVAPHELGDLCFMDSAMVVNGVSSDTYSLNGLTSSAALVVAAAKTPAAEACFNYRSPLSGWYLPSAGELRMLSRNLAAVRHSMMVIEGQDFDDVQYMSSSQDNSSTNNSIINCYCVSLLRGYAVSVSKKEPHRVRPVILIH